MSSKTKNIISTPREPETKYKVLCYVIPFILSGIAVAGYSLKNGLPDAGGYYMIHYLYTYNHGYIARGLVGEVLSLLFDNISDNIISWTVFVFSVLYALTFALFSGEYSATVHWGHRPSDFCGFDNCRSLCFPCNFQNIYGGYKA